MIVFKVLLLVLLVPAVVGDQYRRSFQDYADFKLYTSLTKDMMRDGIYQSEAEVRCPSGSAINEKGTADFYQFIDDNRRDEKLGSMPLFRESDFQGRFKIDFSPDLDKAGTASVYMVLKNACGENEEVYFGDITQGYYFGKPYVQKEEPEKHGISVAYDNSFRDERFGKKFKNPRFEGTVYCTRGQKTTDEAVARVVSPNGVTLGSTKIQPGLREAKVTVIYNSLADERTDDKEFEASILFLNVCAKGDKARFFNMDRGKYHLTLYGELNIIL